MTRPFPRSVRTSQLALLLLASGCVLLALCPLPPSNAKRSISEQQGDRQLKLGSAEQRAEERRIALVIGNGAYVNVSALKNPPGDATLVAATLRRMGFEVTSGVNRSQREMKQLIRDFGQKLRAGGGVGLFYYAGHGVQARGHNYLVPIDAEIQTEADLEDAAVDVNYILNQMDDAQNALNIVILDACRNNPFSRSLRSAQEGLAQVRAPTGTLIAYATAPDSTALDGGGANSPYTEELIKQMESSGVLLETMFRRVTERVSARTAGRQEPWFSANVKGDFYLGGRPTNEGSSNGVGKTQPGMFDPAAIELSFWESIKNSKDPEDFKDYLNRYPNGPFSGLAKRRIAVPSNRMAGVTSAPTVPAALTVPTSGKESTIGKANRDELAKKNSQIMAQNEKNNNINEVVNRTFKLGNDAYMAKRYEEAITAYDEGLAADTEQLALWTNKARALEARAVDKFNKGEKEPAKADMKAAAEAAGRAVQLIKAQPAPTDPAELNRFNMNKVVAMSVYADSMRLFVTIVDKTKTAEGVKAYKDYMAVETDLEKKEAAEAQLAKIMFDANLYDNAFAAYKKILDRNPDDPDALVYSGMALFNLAYLSNDKAKFQEAANFLQRFIEKAPDTHPLKADAKGILDNITASQNIKREATPTRRRG